MEIWITFVLATFLILIIPGPTIILVISQSITHGRKATLPLVMGVMLGDLTAMSVSLLGLGAVMATSAAVFMVFKWIGALYLICLGLKTLLSSPGSQQIDQQDKTSEPQTRFLKRSFLVTALNPKSIAFFVAFLPQFIDPAKGAISEFLLFGGTFLILATLNAALYAIFAVQLKELLQKESLQRWFNRCGGGALIGAGIVTAGMSRTN